MKYISLLAVVFVMVSCQQAKPNIPKYNKDSVMTVVYTLNGQKQATAGRIDSIVASARFDNENSLAAHWSLDTVWSLSIPNQKDTAKDKNHKPIYDSVKKTYVFNNGWYRLNDQERKTVKIQIIY